MDSKRKELKRRYCLFVFYFLLLILNWNCTSLQQNTLKELPDPLAVFKPTGSFAIGLKKYHFKDPIRKDPFLNDQSPRELMVNVYYPTDVVLNASLSIANRKNIPYYEPRMLEVCEKEMQNSGLNTRIFSAVSTEVEMTPLISEKNKTYPLILFSPGGGCVPETYLSFIRELVSHGFVVVAINHTYNALVSVFPDGSVKRNNPIFQKFTMEAQRKGEDAQERLIQIHSDDVLQVLTGLKEIDLKERLDFSKIGMLGHSLGGMTITYQCFRLATCRAGVNMDGSRLGGQHSLLRSEELTGDLTKPFLFFVGTKQNGKDRNEILEALSKNDITFSLEKYLKFKENRWWVQHLLNVANKKMSHTSLFVFENAEHMAFSDWRLLHSYLLNVQEKSELIQMMKEAITLLRNFFMKNLREQNIPG